MAAQLALNIRREKTSQKDDLVNYMRIHGSVTRMEAFSDLGICELASRIGELEKDGHKIEREWVDGRAKNGRSWRIVRYRLARNW